MKRQRRETTVEPLLGGHPRERASSRLKEVGRLIQFVRNYREAFSKRYIIEVKNDVKRNHGILSKTTTKDFSVATFYVTQLSDVICQGLVENIFKLRTLHFCWPLKRVKTIGKKPLSGLLKGGRGGGGC